MLILSFGCLRFLRESCLLYAFLLGYLPSIFFGLFLQNLLTFICRTAYVVLAVKRKRQSCIGIIIPAYRYNKVIPLHKSARYNIIGVNNYAG